MEWWREAAAPQVAGRPCEVRRGEVADLGLVARSRAPVT